jgi:hypothetical protein
MIFQILRFCHIKKPGNFTRKQSKMMIKPSELNEFINEHGLDNEEIADLSSSNTRSVYRWRSFGVPEAKWELIKLKFEKENKK